MKKVLVVAVVIASFVGGRVSVSKSDKRIKPLAEEVPISSSSAGSIEKRLRQFGGRPLREIPPAEIGNDSQVTLPQLQIPQPTEIQKQFDALSEVIASEIHSEYAQLFAELGLGPTTSAVYQEKIFRIRQAFYFAEQYLGQLLVHSAAYRQQLDRDLGDEQFEKYQLLEAERPAKRELSGFEEFLQKSGLPAKIPPDAKQSLLLAMTMATQEREPTAGESPLGGLPRPQHYPSSEALQSYYEAEIARIDREKELLLTGLDAAIEASPYLDLLAEYYSQQVSLKWEEFSHFKSLYDAR